MSGIDTHLLLCRIHWKGLQIQSESESDLLANVQAALAAFQSRLSVEFNLEIQLTRSALKSDVEQGSLYYAYWSPRREESHSGSTSVSVKLDDEQIRQYLQALNEELKAFGCCQFNSAVDVNLSRLTEVMNLDGAQQDAVAQFHYVVETDVEHGWLQEVCNWYDIEHMPGLSRVPGCVNAKRYINQDSGPYSLACYDLLAPEVLGCPEWLAVRGTAWSDVARPHFVNTRRNMFKIV